eukprot:XP_010656126.2 PREDICTED: growth-regulating factor 1 isoform X2 [Vitis vinifera]
MKMRFSLSGAGLGFVSLDTIFYQSMMSGRNRFPFTATQWQELEHQALIFKYMASGMPIPPDLIFSIKRSLDSPLPTSKLFPTHQSQHIGWNCFQMGLGRKVDPEPGRCRRTDGKKWRCAKEAYPDSKYCERHMHRGRNRSRKPVEVMTPSKTPPTVTTPTATMAANPPPPISSITVNSSNPTSYSLALETQNHHTHRHPSCYNTHLHLPFLYPHSSSSRPPGFGGGVELSPQHNTTHLLLDSGSYSQTDYRNRYVHGLKEEVDEHAFFSEQPSGATRSFSGSSMDDPWRLTPLKMNSSPLDHSKQRSCSVLQSDYSCLQLQSLSDTSNQKQDQHFYVLGSNLKYEKHEREEPEKTVHRFFDEWPPKSRDPWPDSEDKSPRDALVSTTQLSISMPNSSFDFSISNSRPHNDD